MRTTRHFQETPLLLYTGLLVHGTWFYELCSLLLCPQRYIVVSLSSDKWTYCNLYCMLWIKASDKRPECKWFPSVKKPLIYQLSVKVWLWFHVDATHGGNGPTASLRTLLAVPPCVQQGLWLVRSLKPYAEPQQVYDCVKAYAWSLRRLDVEQ